MLRAKTFFADLTMISRLDKRFGTPLGWDDWTTTVCAVTTKVGLLVKEGHLAMPVDVHITSEADESLLSYRVESTDPKGWGHIIDSDESKWHNADIFPVTAIISDRNGAGFELTIDSRLEKIN